MGFLATTTSISDLLPNYLVGNTTASDTAGVAIFSRHIDRAEGLIMSSISGRYDGSKFTTTNYPPILRQIAEDISCFYAIRGASTQDSGKENKNLKWFEQAFSTLSMIVEGEMKLAYTDGSLVLSNAGSKFKSSATGYTQIFNLDTETAWGLSPTQSDDIDEARE